MDWISTLLTLAIAVAVGLWSRTRAGRPSVPGRVNYVPYTAFLFLAVLTALFMMAHALQLMGVVFPSRAGF